MAYWGLFFTAFLAATLLPAQSEALLVGLILQQKYTFALLIASASLGNTLGSVVNWWLGRYVERFQHKTWFPVGEQALQRAQIRFQRYGVWTLLLSWLPIIGDHLTIIAGVMRVPFWQFLMLVALAKGGRYLVLGVPVYLSLG